MCFFIKFQIYKYFLSISFFKLAHDIYYLSNEVHLKGLENKYILKIKRVFKNAQSHYNESYYLTNKCI